MHFFSGPAPRYRRRSGRTTQGQDGACTKGKRKGRGKFVTKNMGRSLRWWKRYGRIIFRRPEERTMSSTPLNTLIARCRVLCRPRPQASDADLLRRFVGQRDPAAFEELLERYAPL